MRKEYDFSKGRRGAVIPIPPGKTRMTIRIDDEILDWFRERVDEAGGGSYQTLINQALRSVMESPRESVERAVRRAVREEFVRYAARRPSRAPRSLWSLESSPLGTPERLVALVAPAKVRAYLLSREHPVGCFKAIAFETGGRIMLRVMVQVQPRASSRSRRSG